jgi:hypothetical protein
MKETLGTSIAGFRDWLQDQAIWEFGERITWTERKIRISEENGPLAGGRETMGNLWASGQERVKTGGPEMAESPQARGRERTGGLGMAENQRARGRDRDSGRMGRSSLAADGPETAGGLCGRGTDSRRKSPKSKAWRRAA